MSETTEVFVYYETIEGESGLAKVGENGVTESSVGEYGTSHELDWPSFVEFVQGADDERPSFDDLSTDADGFYYPDGHIRFKVIRGHELGRGEWSEL